MTRVQGTPSADAQVGLFRFDLATGEQLTLAIPRATLPGLGALALAFSSETQALETDGYDVAAAPEGSVVIHFEIPGSTSKVSVHLPLDGVEELRRLLALASTKK